MHGQKVENDEELDEELDDEELKELEELNKA